METKRQELEARIAFVRKAASEWNIRGAAYKQAQRVIAAAERELAELTSTAPADDGIDAADDAPVNHYSADGCYIRSCHHCALCHDCVKRDCKASDCVTCLQSRHDGHSGFALCPATDCPDFTRIGEAH